MDDEVRRADLAQERVNAPGTPSEFACPDCQGVLWEIEEGGLLRFHCHVGHAYTPETLKRAMSDSTEAALWAAMRALEEKAALFRRLAPCSGERLGPQYLEDAEGYDNHTQRIRRLLLESRMPQAERIESEDRPEPSDPT